MGRDFFWRYRAESNRCGSFCRAQPNHSATVPKRLNTEDIKTQNIKKLTLWFACTLYSKTLEQLLSIIHHKRTVINHLHIKKSGGENRKKFLN